jgi:uncharacterized protein YprB with RNaseH-like and TPR domain
MAAKIVILDIETTSLEADAGVLVSAGLMSDTGRSEYLEARRTSQEKSLLSKLSRRLEGYDVVITWNGRSFDIPFLTTRLMKHGIDPRSILRKSHIDLADVVKSRLRLTFTYLDHVCDFFDIDRKKGPMGLDVPHLYVQALEGDRKASSSIREHCLDDLRATRQVFLRLKPLVEQQLEYAEGHS